MKDQEINNQESLSEGNEEACCCRQHEHIRCHGHRHPCACGNEKKEGLCDNDHKDCTCKDEQCPMGISPHDLYLCTEEIKSYCEDIFPDDPGKAVSLLQVTFVSYVFDVFGSSDDVLDRMMDAVYEAADNLRREGYGQ